MKRIYKGLLGLSAIALLSLGSCKKYRDINTNPNNPEIVDIKLLLPSAEAGIAQQVGGKFQVIGGMWSQYWTQSPVASQYRVVDQYQIAGSDVNNGWNGLYADALMDLQKIVELSGSQKNYAAIAKILQGYTFQVLTDQFGDIPFSEALKGESANITSPHYDKQEDVYKGIIALVQEGMNELDPNSPAPGTDDLIYGGDLSEWQRFGNTLLLKMYMRLSVKSPAMAEAGVDSLYASGIGFLEEGETAQITYGTAAGSYNPLYSEMNNAVINQTQNLIASATLTDSMNANEDERLTAFYTAGSGGYVGNDQGDISTETDASSFAIPGPAVGGNAVNLASATAPVLFISDYESLLLQAEAAARGWGDGDAAELFGRAISANFDAYGLDATDYLANARWAQYPAAGTMEEQIEFIITQKWFCMCGNEGLEAWTEWRRTGYPGFFVISKSSRIGNNFPQRFPYPDEEVTNNANFPGQKSITDKVWWDVN
ncbi:SusD/RagB family nutrient-binding outer membrane lipoprotein [Taibaiella lutea]|nr:SusD/RagB family nutrient-binding outer membrane lipoprotein [Taibaiella lutea]